MKFRYCILALLPVLVTSAPAQTFEEQVIELTNQERWDNGQLPPLKFNALLGTAAETHTVNMSVRDFWSSCDLDLGTIPADRLVAEGYVGAPVAENIGAAYSTPSAVMTAWMFSIGTRDRILSPNYREVGVGFEYDPGDLATVRFDDGTCQAAPGLNGPFQRYWTQDFGFRADVFPVVINREAYETSIRAVELHVYGSGWGIKMRFRNGTTVWSAWEVFSDSKSWFLTAGDGVKTVEVEIQGPGEIRSATDSIVLSGSVVGIPDPRVGGAPVLHPARPNPFRSATTVTFDLTRPGAVRLSVYDVSGRRVATLLNEVREAGSHNVPWSGRGDSGNSLPAGLYFVRLDAAGMTRTTKLLLTP